VHVHADHRRESYVYGMGQVNETGGHETGGIDGPETDVDEISPFHSLIHIYEMTSSLNTPSPSEIPSKSTTPKLAYRTGLSWLTRNSRMVGYPEVGQKRGSRKLDGLVTGSRLVGSDHRACRQCWDG
jgi:hypothetical protein